MTKFGTTSQDWFNHIAQNLTTNAIIQYVLYPEGKIELKILREALYQLIHVEPILGCVFTDEKDFPYWEPIPLDMNEICFSTKTQNIENEIFTVLSEKLQESNQLPIKIYLINNEDSNAIVIKINHSVCDGAGSKYIVRLLADIYSRLESGKVFNSKVVMSKRDTSELYAQLNIKDINKYFEPEKAELISSWGFPIVENKLKDQKFQFEQLSYSKDELHQLKHFAQKHNVKLNAILTAAYFDALIKILKPSEKKKELQFMIDLRKYLPDYTSYNVCNLSSIQNIELPTDTSDFIELTYQADIAIKNILASENYIHGVIAGDLGLNAGYSAMKSLIASEWDKILTSGKCTPMISNLGELLNNIMYFGKTKIKNVNLITPAFFAPAFMLGVSTYNNVLTLSASFYSPGINHSQIRLLLGNIDQTLKHNILNRSL